MPGAVATAATYLTTGVGYASMATAYGASWTAAIAYGVGYVAGAYGLSVAAEEAMEKDRSAGTGESLGQKLKMRKNPAQPHRVIYGECRVGADLTFYDVNNGGKDLHMVCVFAGHPCESIEDIFLNGEALSLDSNGVAQGKYSAANVKVNEHLGNQTSADSDLVNNAKVWSSTDVGNDITYIYLRAQAENREDHRELFQGIPDVSAVVKGKNNIFDPRDSSIGYTNNPSLCVRDFITSDKYGYGFGSDLIDEEDVKTSANNCEEQVNGKDRYTCNGSFRDDARNDDVLRDLLTSMAGETVWAQGKQRILSGAWRPTVDTFDEGQVVSSINTETKRSRQELFNTVRGTYANPKDNYQPTSFPQVQEDRFLNEDDNVVIPKTIELSFTTDEEEAQRVARVMLRKHRLQETLSATFNIEAFNAQGGDNVGLSIPRYSWEPKKFHVKKWKLKLEQEDESGFRPLIDMNLQARDSSVFHTGNLETTSISSPAVSFS